MTVEGNDTAATEEFVGRVFDAGLKALELTSMYIGDRLGLYKTLSEAGPATSAELAARTGLSERYLREWLEQQAVSSVLTVHEASLPAARRRYELPAAHGAALLDPESPFSIAPIAQTAAILGMAAPMVADAFKTGGGVPWGAYGEAIVDVQGDFNRPWLMAQLGQEFLPSIPDVHAPLAAPAPARVLDVACGVGWASLAIAKAYPNVSVHGIDIDGASIERAKSNAAAAGLGGRVRFEARDAAGLASEQPYDFAVIVEAVHDMSDPVGVLSAVRKALAPGASLMVVDERVQDEFTAPGDEVERFMYCASVLLCLPAAMTETPSAATGTVMRTSTLRRYAIEAGFTSVEVLDIDHPMLRFYRLT